eukprot:1159286-Rhodomonas_salina.1
MASDPKGPEPESEEPQPSANGVSCGQRQSRAEPRSERLHSRDRCELCQGASPGDGQQRRLSTPPFNPGDQSGGGLGGLGSAHFPPQLLHLWGHASQVQLLAGATVCQNQPLRSACAAELSSEHRVANAWEAERLPQGREAQGKPDAFHVRARVVCTRYYTALQPLRQPFLSHPVQALSPDNLPYTPHSHFAIHSTPRTES